jgi:hypothetical protein
MVITNIGFDPKASYPKLTFSYGGFLDEEAYNTVADRVQSDEVLEIIGMQPQQTAAPVVEDEDEDEDVQEVIAEPVEVPKSKVKKGFGASEEPKAKSKAKSKPAPVVEDDEDEDEDDDDSVAVIDDLTELGDLFGD